MSLKRIFFAVTFSQELQKKIFETLVSGLPKEGFGKTKKENLHITLVFLGNAAEEKISKLKTQAQKLENFERFEAELGSIGHFKGKILWLGIGKGTQEFNLLAKKLCAAIETECDNFHAHATLARNKGAGKKEFDGAVEKLREKNFLEKITIRGFDLMESELTEKGPFYRKLFSIEFKN